MNKLIITTLCLGSFPLILFHLSIEKQNKMLAFAINCVNMGCLSVCVTPYQYNYYPITDLLYCVLLHYPGKGQYPQNRRYCNVDKGAQRNVELKIPS